MKKLLAYYYLGSVVAASILLSAAHVSAAGVTTWAGAGGANQNWSAAVNWTTVGGSTPPGAGDIVVFRAAGSAAVGITNNVVDAGFTAVPGGLLFSNEVANTFHTTYIPAGNTLTINGPMTFGGTNQVATYTVAGEGTLHGGTGTSTFIVATGNGGAITNDLSQLNTFIFNAGGAGGTFSIGLDPGFSSGGTLKLAAVSNNITATTLSVGNNNSSGTSTLILGAGTNVINANTLNLGNDKSLGTIQFGSATGGLRLRNAAGTTGRTTVTVSGNGHSGSSSATTIGNFNLKGHYVDMMIGSLTLASRNARTGGSDNAYFSFDNGVVDCLFVNGSTNLANGTGPTNIVSVGGGVLKVANGYSMVACAGNPGLGMLIVTNGGMVTCGGTGIFKTSATGQGIISITNATVTLASPTAAIGNPSQPIDTLNLDGATLRLNLDNNAPQTSITANTINTNGVNVIAIDSIANAASTMTFTLISYSGTDPFGALTLSLPAGYTGSLVDSAGQVELTVTAPTIIPLTWKGSTNSVLVNNWDTNKTKNWVDAGNAAQPYANPDPVTFDDTADNAVVTLLTTNTPNSITVNNSVLNYIFNGPGKISDGVSLTKQGSASLTLADNGDDFVGGITVGAGTLILDNTNGAISGGLTISGGATAQIGNNDAYGALPSGTVEDDGALVFAPSGLTMLATPITGAGELIQNGSGTLVISTVNSYAGITIASRGTLALTGAGSVSNSPGLLVTNATFDVSGISGRTLLNDFSVANAALNLNANPLTPLTVNSFEADGILARSNIINVASLPGIAYYPATIPLIKSASPITLGAGNFNFAVGALPAASPSYAATVSESADASSILLTVTSGPIGVRSSATWAGVNNVTATTNWSDALNWQLPGAPTSIDNLVFGDYGAGTDSATVNNVVDTSLTVTSLTYNQDTSGLYHVTEIPTGVTLTVSGNVTVGNLPAADNTVTATYMTGGGTFRASGSAFSVNDFGSGSSSSLATLDLSGLGTFIFNSSVGTMNIANATSGNRFGGLLVLAGGSNNITAGTLNFMQNNASNGGNGSSGLQFGAGTNVVNVGTFNIVGGKNSGTVNFSPAAPATAGLRIRGVTGNSDDNSRAALTVGVRTSTGTGTTAGTLALNGNPVDIKASTLLIGEDTQSGGNGANGTLSFDTGTVDVTGITMAHTGNAAVTSGVGTINVGAAGRLIVGSGGVSLLNQAAGSGAAGTLNVTGGTVICSNSIVKATAAGTATISLTDGSLNMVSGVIGTLAMPIDSLNLSDNGSLDTKITLNVVAGVTNIVGNLNVSGVTTINIASLVGVNGTSQISIISYTGGSPMSGLALGSVPFGYTGASLVDTGTTIDLVVTPPAPFVWRGAVGSVINGNWDIGGTANWLNGVSPAVYADVDFVKFDDSASNGVVTLTTALAPANINVDNATLNYTFTGPGKLGGSVALIKQGAASLTLDNSGVNDFTGGLNIVAGTVQVGNNDANGNLPAGGGIIDNGALVLNRTDSNTVANAISGSGTLSQTGSGTNRLAAVNSYTGDTLISSGLLIATNAVAGTSSLGSTDSGAVTITNGGTLDIENPLAQAICYTNTSDSAGKQFYIAGAGVGGAGVIVNNGTVNQQNAFQNITLTADATVGGPARWDMRVPDGLFQPILDLGGFTLTKTGSNQMSMVGLIVTNGGNIVINSGILSFETISSNSATHITVNAGGVLGHFRQNATLFTAPITLNGGSIRDLNGTPGSTNDSPITLTANSTLDLNVGSSDQVRLNGNITESGGSFGLTKTNVGSYSLSGINTYSGTTLVAMGTLILADNGSIAQSKSIQVAAGATFDASQRIDQTLTLNTDQVLGGFGTVTGLVSAVGGSTVAPGSASSIGTLTFANNVTLAGTNTMKVTHGAVATNDLLNVVNGSTLTLGGTLNIALLGGGFAGGDTFTLYHAPGGLAGTFSATNLPALGGGLGWVTTNLVNGVLSIVATVNTNPTNVTATVTGNTLTLSWPADHVGWRLLVQTNALGAGLNPSPNAWYPVSGSDSVDTESFTMDPSQGTVFYRLVYP